MFTEPSDAKRAASAYDDMQLCRTRKGSEGFIECSTRAESIMNNVRGMSWAPAATVPITAAPAIHRRVAKVKPVARNKGRETSAATTAASIAPTAAAGPMGTPIEKAPAAIAGASNSARPAPSQNLIAGCCTESSCYEDGKGKRKMEKLRSPTAFHIPFPLPLLRAGRR